MWWYPHTDQVLTWQANRETDKTVHNVPGHFHSFFIGKVIGYHILKVIFNKQTQTQTHTHTHTHTHTYA